MVRPRHDWLRYVFPRRLDIVPTVLYLLFIATYPWLSAGTDWMRAGAETLTRLAVNVSIVAGMLALDRIDAWRFPKHRPALAAAGQVALHVGLLGLLVRLDGGWPSYMLIPLLPYVGFMYVGARWASLASGLLWLGVLGIAISFDDWAHMPSVGNALVQYTSFTLLALLVTVSSATALGERTQREQTEALLPQLNEAYRRLDSSSREALAAQEARNRLARDIHDGLGHYLTVINVQLEKALAYWAVDPTVAGAALRDAGRLVHEALREVQRAGPTLHASADAFSLPDALCQLADHCRASFAVDLRIDGSPEGFAAPSLVAIYRVAQEGLTNIQKHGRASRAVIAVTFAGDEARLHIADNGDGFDPTSAQRNGGYGLQGMRERLEVVGGTLRIESQPGMGAALDAVVPRAPLTDLRRAHDTRKQESV